MRIVDDSEEWEHIITIIIRLKFHITFSHIELKDCIRFVINDLIWKCCLFQYCNEILSFITIIRTSHMICSLWICMFIYWDNTYLFLGWNHQGSFLWAFRMRLSVFPVIKSEFWGFLNGLQMWSGKGIRRILVESDSLDAVTLINGWCNSVHPCFNLVEEIKWVVFDVAPNYLFRTLMTLLSLCSVVSMGLCPSNPPKKCLL